MANKKKIALVGFHLYGGGGARVMSNLSNYFHSKNFEVHNIILSDDLGFSYSGNLMNLGKLKSKQNTIFNKIKRFMALKKYMKQYDFEFVLDFRFREKLLQEFLISRFVYNRKKTIYTVHSSKLDVYIPKSKFWTKLIYGKCYRMVALTKVMELNINKCYPGILKTSTIYNPIDIKAISLKSKESINIDFEYVIGAGSFDVDIKQFGKLIIAYSKSILSKQKVHLVILGTGKLLETLKSVAKENNVSNFVHFLGFENNPYKYFSKSKFFILSSLFEGLPMVLLEALACKTPVVSYNCPTGPKEIVIDEENGLLIENQNLEALTYGINRMLTDKKLYKNCKDNAPSSIQNFSVEVVGKEWLNIMNIKY